MEKLVRMTLVYPMKYVAEEWYVLLAKKARKIGAGKWNGFGGKIEGQTAIRTAAVLELEQESGLIANAEDLRPSGILHFYNPEFHVVVHAFLISKWDGFVRESEEMSDPTWFPVSELPPPGEFMPADPYFLRFLLSGSHNVVLKAHYNSGQKELLKIPEISLVSSF